MNRKIIIEYLKKNYYEDRLGSFSEDIRPLACLRKLLGIVPILDKNDIKNNSKIYRTYIFFLIKNVFLMMLIVHQYQFLPKTEIYMKNGFLLLPLMLKIYYIVAGSANIVNFNDLVNDVDFHCKTLVPKCLLKKVRYYRYVWVFISLIFGCCKLLLYVMYFTSMSAMNFSELCSMFLRYDLLYALMIFDQVFYFLLSYEVIIRIDLLKNSMTKRYKELIVARCSHILIMLNLDRYRYIYDKLSSTIKMFENLSGIFYLYFLTTCLIDLSWLMNQIYEDNQVILEVFIYLFWNISTVLLLLKTSTLITENSENFINILLSQPISHLDEGVQQEILLFIQQARDAKQDITAYDFFTVNNKTIFVLVGQILTYFIFWGQEDVNN